MIITNDLAVIYVECVVFPTYVFILARYYEEFQIDRQTGESNLTQLYIQVGLCLFKGPSSNHLALEYFHE